MNAFERWFQETYSANPAAGEVYLFVCAQSGPSDSVVWDYLEQTGDEVFDRNTFRKAADLILSKKKEAV